MEEASMKGGCRCVTKVSGVPCVTTDGTTWRQLLSATSSTFQVDFVSLKSCHTFYLHAFLNLCWVRFLACLEGPLFISI